MSWARRKQAVTAGAERGPSWLRRDGNGRLLSVSLLARIPLGLGGVVPLLLVLDRTGSAAAAGSSVAAYGLGVFATAPRWGRLADRSGPRAAMRTCVLGTLAAFVALALSPPIAPILVILVGVVGGFLPPSNAVMRALWEQRFIGSSQTRV